MLQNKYQKWYMKIIYHATNQKRPQKGHEMHHIIPKCMGGLNKKENLVRLTLREHYICHLLLPKFTTGDDQRKLKFALWCFINKWGRKSCKFKMNSKMYEKLKIEISDQISKLNKGKINPPLSVEMIKKFSERMRGDSNPMYGKLGSENPNFGKKRPGIGGRKKGTTWSDEERSIHLKIRSEIGYYNYLKDPKRGEKISNSQRGRIGTALGKVWYNDGINEYYGNQVPIGFNKGRLISNSSKKGMKWFTNGVVSKQFKEDMQPQDFIRGRIIKK